MAVSGDGRVARVELPSPNSPISFDVAYERYRRYVARIASRIMGPDEEVKDIVQDVFVIVYERLNQLDDPNAIKAWIASITVNVARGRLRWRRVRHSLQWVASKVLTGTPEASPEHSAMLKGVYRVLEGMPDGQRIAWILRYVEQESVETTATILGCSEATVKRWAGRAQQTLTEEEDHD